MGDFGTLFPLLIGYIAVCGVDPAGLLIMIGIANIVTGIVYRLPIPVEPMKVLAVVAISQHWTPSMVYASGAAMGIVWIFFAATGIIGLISKITPLPVIRGIQIALGVMLAVEAYKMISTWWALGVASIIIVLILRQNRYAPAAIVLVFIGIIITYAGGQMPQIHLSSISLPSISRISMGEIWLTMILAGFAQIPLTITNATISTSSLITSYWPDRSVSEKQLSWNQGIINLILPFFGGMPMCHGAGGLASQYYFGARTGGANILEGVIEISLGLFLAGSIGGLLSVFPVAIIGAMMFLVGLELTKFAKDIRVRKDLISMGTTVAGSLLLNMAWGFLAGLAVHYIMHYFKIRNKG